MNTKPQNIKLATLFALTAAVTFAIAGGFVKLIGSAVPTTMIVFFRFFISLIILLPWFLKDPMIFKIDRPIHLICRSICGMLSLACLFYAIKYISLADGLLLNNTNALFVPLVAWIMLGTRTPFKVWLAIIIGFIGVICILHPDAHIFNQGALIGLASGIFGAISLVQIRQLTKISSTQQILFYYFITGALITGLMLPFLWVTPSLMTCLLLIGVGVTSTIFQVLVVLSFTHAPVRLMSSVMFSSVIFGAVIDGIFWHIFPDFLTVIGATLIIIGSMTAIYFGQKTLISKIN